MLLSCFCVQTLVLGISFISLISNPSIDVGYMHRIMHNMHTIVELQARQINQTPSVHHAYHMYTAGEEKERGEGLNAYILTYWYEALPERVPVCILYAYTVWFAYNPKMHQY